MSLAALAPFLVVGLLGSLHCIGMCGPFAIAATARPGEGGRTSLWRGLLYITGKALTYAVLGTLAAQAAHLLTHAGASVAGEGAGEGQPLELLRRGLAWFAGGIMVLLGAWSLGLRAAAHATGLGEVTARILAPFLQAARALGGSGSAFGIGLVTGLLPCGLSWSALALATQLPPASAALALFLFGLATAPALLACGLGWASLPPAARARLGRVAAGVVILFGVLTAARGGLPLGGESSRALLPPCCQGAAADAPR